MGSSNLSNTNFELAGQFNFTTSESEINFQYISAINPSKSATTITITALNANDNTRQYIIIFVCSSVGLFILVLIIYGIRCYIMGRGEETTGYMQTDLEVKNKIEKIINKSPQIKFCCYKSKYNQTGCSVCLLPFEPESTIRLLKCLHIFHDACIIAWLNTKTENFTCPICNTQLNSEETTPNNGEHVIFYNDFT